MKPMITGVSSVGYWLQVGLGLFSCNCNSESQTGSWNDSDLAKCHNRLCLGPLGIASFNLLSSDVCLLLFVVFDTIRQWPLNFAVVTDDLMMLILSSLKASLRKQSQAQCLAHHVQQYDSLKQCQSKVGRI